MSFNIIKQLNAEEQEPKAAENAEATASTNELVQETTTTEATPETAHDDFDWSRDKEMFLLIRRMKKKSTTKFMSLLSDKLTMVK